MNIDWNFLVNIINGDNVHRVVSVRPSDAVRKERSKKGKTRDNRSLDDTKKVSFNDCLLRIIEEQKDCEEDKNKRLFK